MLQFDWNNGVLDVPAKLSVAITHTVTTFALLLSTLYTSLSVGWFFAFSCLTLCGLFYVMLCAGFQGQAQS